MAEDDDDDDEAEDDDDENDNADDEGTFKHHLDHLIPYMFLYSLWLNFPNQMHSNSSCNCLYWRVMSIDKAF